MRAWLEQHRQEGKLPVVEAERTGQEIKGAHGSNFQPQFVIKKLVDRPADLNGEQRRRCISARGRCRQ